MTELEKIIYAKSFIDKLANGIDPISDKPVPQDEIINNVRVTRCLFYVSDILKQVIDNGGTEPPRRLRERKKTPFYITDQQLNSFRFSDKPIPISEITRRINELIDTDRMKSFRYKDIIDWLLELGALKIIENEEGKPRKHPTEIGNELGITLEERYNWYRTYHVVLYDRSAQQFIIDNIRTILEFRQSKNALEIPDIFPD